MALNIEEHKALAAYTTFKIGGPARYFCAITDEKQIPEAVEFARHKNMPFKVFGGGSNLLVSDVGYPGLVIHMELKGMDFVETEGDEVVVSVAAGEDWDGFVAEAVRRGYYGIENLTAIPGTVGAAPVQNVGAYGVEAGNIIESVRAYDVQEHCFKTIAHDECGFVYRDSMFKHAKDRYIVTSVTFLLSKKGIPNIEYADLARYFAAQKNAAPTLTQIREAVIDIRRNKLPDWKSWGTAGSFFKNPIIDMDQFKILKEKYPELPGYPEADPSKTKVSLGWILDKLCDAKGLCIGKACTYEKQALVIVANVGATAEDVFALAQELMKRVKETTGINIEGEVEWVVA